MFQSLNTRDLDCLLPNCLILMQFHNGPHKIHTVSYQKAGLRSTFEFLYKTKLINKKLIFY
jgi:hypothetical protein